MRRITISLDDALADTFDRLVEEKGYVQSVRGISRSTARCFGGRGLQEGVAKYCVGALSYVYNIMSASCRGG